MDFMLRDRRGGEEDMVLVGEGRFWYPRLLVISLQGCVSLFAPTWICELQWKANEINDGG